MKMEDVLPFASKFVGRDLTLEYQLFCRARDAALKSLDQNTEIMLKQNWFKLPDFLESPEGQKAFQELMSKWGESMRR